MQIFIAHCSDMLTDYRPHGDGLVAYGFIRGLAERGHILHVAVQGSDIRGPLSPNIRLYPIKTREGRGVRQRLEYMVGIRKLFKKLRSEHQIDIVHQLNPVFAGLSLALVGSKTPLVLGPYVGKWPDKVRHFGVKQTFARKLILKGRTTLAYIQQSFANAILATTPNALSQVPGRKSGDSRIHLFPLGIDSDFFMPAPGWDSLEAMRQDQASPSILFYAHIWYGKGLDLLISAFDEVADAIPGVSLTVAGDGEELPAIKLQASKLAHANQIEFLGMWPRDKAANVFHKASLYCLPSRGEPFAQTILEAMSFAKPMVVTNAGGLGYMVLPQGGRVVPVDDPRALAAALIEVLSDPELRLAMAKFNRSHIESTYRWDKLAEKLEGIYREIIVKS